MNTPSNLLEVLFISAIRVGTDQPVIYLNLHVHDPDAYQWLLHVVPKGQITIGASALAPRFVLTEAEWHKNFYPNGRAPNGNIANLFDLHFAPDDSTGVELVTMLVLGNYFSPLALRQAESGSVFIKQWLSVHGLDELMIAQRELKGGCE
jgi:hypothetical protein